MAYRDLEELGEIVQQCLVKAYNIKAGMLVSAFLDKSVPKLTISYANLKTVRQTNVGVFIDVLKSRLDVKSSTTTEDFQKKIFGLESFNITAKQFLVEYENNDFVISFSRIKAFDPKIREVYGTVTIYYKD